MNEEFEAIVIGSGQPGLFLAVRMAAAGQRVVIIERLRELAVSGMYAPPSTSIGPETVFEEESKQTLSALGRLNALTGEIGAKPFVR
jgi:choline dehydrogenase-like flavoprotein